MKAQDWEDAMKRWLSSPTQFFGTILAAISVFVAVSFLNVVRTDPMARYSDPNIGWRPIVRPAPQKVHIGSRVTFYGWENGRIDGPHIEALVTCANPDMTADRVRIDQTYVWLYSGRTYHVACQTKISSRAPPGG